MLICFGVSWPVQIVKTIKAKNPAGKSLLFIALVITGYICGIFFKILGRFDWVIALYFFNACAASLDLALCVYYINRNRKGVQNDQVNSCI